MNQTNTFLDGKEKLSFDEGNIVLRFGAISDLHLHPGRQKFEESLRQLYAKAGKYQLDAIFVAGDLTDNGAFEQVQALKEVLDDFELSNKKIKFLFALGNHDLAFDEKPFNGEMFKQVLADYAFEGASAEEIKNGNHHTTVKGYHFIAVNCKVYNGGCHHLSEDLNWLKTELDRAILDDPQKPIFLATHPVIYDTVYGSKESTYWYSDNIDKLLRNYPQVIVFGGHLHFPLNDERNIYQKNYTALGTGCTLYCSLESEFEGIKPIDTKGGMEPEDCHSFSQGLYLEVDKNHNVKVTRMDFLNKAKIKEPWIIPSPKQDKSHLSKYTSEAVSLNNKAPFFLKSAEAVLQIVSKDKLTIKFDAAFDDDYVYYYELHLAETKKHFLLGKKPVITYSDFYRVPDPKEMKKRLTKVIDVAAFNLPSGELKSGVEYCLKLVAVDSFGLKSEPIYSNCQKLRD